MVELTWLNNSLKDSEQTYQPTFIHQKLKNEDNFEAFYFFLIIFNLL